MILHSLDRYRDEGLLVLRIGFGVMFLFHGVPKLLGGPEKWEGLGRAMETFGVSFAPTFWGLAASLSEAGGGLLLLLGLLTRPAAAALAVTMIVAASKHLAAGDGILRSSHAIEDGVVFLALILIGPGKLSLDQFLVDRRRQR